MDDDDLMEKHQISFSTLQKLVAELLEAGYLKRTDRYAVVPSERSVNAKMVVHDIRAGLSKSDLMQKHRLSSRALKGLVTILLDTGALTRDELYGDLYSPFDAVTPEHTRSLKRYYVDFDTPVYEAKYPETQGRVVDISEDGVGLLGLETQVDEVKTLVILGDALSDVAPFEFRARCVWCRRDPVTGELLSGFQIVRIAEESLRDLKRLIRLVTFEG